MVSPDHHPIGTCKLSTILRTPRSTPVSDIMAREQTLIPVDMDQEDVALRFQKYALVSAAVIDDAGRLVGMITVDDIVHIIQEEAGEDVLLLSGAGDGDINEPIGLTVRRRLTWLVINLGTAILAAARRRPVPDRDQPLRRARRADADRVGMGGNAGTQTLAVAVRALATNQLTYSNTVRMFGARIEDRARQRAFARPADRHRRRARSSTTRLLGFVIGLAMVINNLVAGLAGIVVPVALDRADVDPAVSSAVFVTTVTDVMGFFSFLGLASAFGLGR